MSSNHLTYHIDCDSLGKRGETIRRGKKKGSNGPIRRGRHSSLTLVVIDVVRPSEAWEKVGLTNTTSGSAFWQVGQRRVTDWARDVDLGRK